MDFFVIDSLIKSYYYQFLLTIYKNYKALTFISRVHNAFEAKKFRILL